MDYTIRLTMEIEPARKYDGYHTRFLVRDDYHLPFTPFVGLKLVLDDAIFRIVSISWIESSSVLECSVVDEVPSPPDTEDDVDQYAASYLEYGWRDDWGSRPLSTQSVPPAPPATSPADRPT